LVLSALLGTAALLVWLLLWLAPPGPACLVLAGAGYEDNLALAHNARGREALVRLAGLASTSTPLSSLFRRSGRLRLAHAPMEVRRGGDWARGLEGALEKTVVVVLAMHGGADREGAYLWPHDTTGAVEDRIRVGAVLARLAELPRGRNKLLVLDATGLAEMRSAGMLVNDFARALGDLDERIRAVPNLVVLASTDADQRSQPAADGRTTLFMRHLLEGLREGRSAGPGGRLDAWQLYQQVRQRVEDDARRLRGAVQTPVLLPREGGEARARAIPLTFQFGEDGEERPVGEADFASAERAVREAWAGYRTLNPRVAAACAPQAWRLYQAWLVRHEQLRLAGADAAADVALVRAREAAEGVRRGTDLNLATTNASLAMPALAGAVGLWGPDPDPRLERLWRAAPAEQVAAWGELRKGADLPALRRDLQAGLVRRAADNPARNLAAAAALVRLIDDPASAARPAEAHYLVMLQRDLATRPPPAELALLLARALRLRLRAERDALAVGDGGYAYAERIYPATRALIDAADRDRERGQDLAFASTPDDWARGHACLDEAQKKYDQAQGLASALRAAHAARDRALAELPGHAGWIGAVRAAPDDLGKTAAGLFEEARGLERLLAGPPGELGELRRRAARVEGGLDGLQKRLDGFARTCESNSPAAATDAEAVLAAPTLSAEVRFRLVRKLGRLAWRARSAEDGAVTVSAAAEGRERLARARRRATLALAELGAGWFDRVSGKGRESLSDVEQRIRLLDEERWWKPVRLAGDQIGDRVRRLPPDVDRLVRLARQESRVGSPLASLAQADDQVRRLDPGQCQEVQGEPAVLARKARLQGLLVWQAGRAWQGHWYGDDPEATPYFRIVGLDYLRDARDLAPFPGGGVPGADVVRRRLGQDNGLRIGGAPVRRLLAGERMTLANALEPAGGEEVSGYPLFWAEPGAGLILARLQDADRRPVEVRPGKPADRLAVTVASPRLERAEEDPPARAKPESSGVVWRALYRGARLARAQVVELYAAAESVRVLHPRPRAAALAVRSSPRLLEEYGVARGALAIVLDCSGSMGPPQGQAMTENTRFRQATRALRAVLARVPRGVAVSLWVFGQRDGGGATPEDTIMRLQEPVTWRRQAGQLDDLMSRVEGLTPWNETPLVRAMLRAKDDLTRAAGFRTMVVITDGADNRFAGDRVYNPGKESIPDVLKKRFRDSRVAVHVVGFQIADKDEQEARKHFEVLKELTPRGSFTLVNRLDALTRRLDAVMQPGLRYRLVGEVDGEAVRGEEVDVAAEGENDRWLALPGASAAYRLEVSAGWPMAQKIELRPGDAMRVRVYAAGRRPECERLLYGEEESFRRRPAREGRGWRTTVLESRPADGRGLGMLVALEKRPEVGEPVIRQVRPGNVWLEVDPAGVSSGGATVHWGETFGYPAPVWKVGVPGWPASGGGPAAPRLRVWWAPEREGPGRVLRRGPDFRTLRDLAGDVRVAGDEAHLDGVTVERRWVPARAGGREQRWCLVVRASHAPGKLLWARPDTTLALGGQEHRFHTSAARYVGLFWFVGLETREALEEQLDDKLAALQLVSVGAFKKEAEGRMLFAGFNDLSTPAAESGGPRPVLGAE
jgi:hypothetical protein